VTSEDSTPYFDTVYNNICDTYVNGTYMRNGATTPTSNYNDFYNLACVADRNGGNSCMSLSVWQSQPGSPDLNSITSNPNLSDTYVPNAGSPAIGGRDEPLQHLQWTAQPWSGSAVQRQGRRGAPRLRRSLGPGGVPVADSAQSTHELSCHTALE
jgi:hypothetical protein